MGQPASDAVIVGGGVIGLACAYYLAGAGARVTVLERGRAGAEASWAAAGMLAAGHEVGQPGPFANLCRASRELFPALAAALQDETGIDVEYDTAGALEVARDEADLQELAARAGRLRRAGLPAELLSADQVRELEPGLRAGLAGGLLLAGDHQVNNRALVAALREAARLRGAAIEEETEVTGWLLAPGRERVQGVEAAGRRYPAGAVVLAAGAWSGVLGDRLGLSLPVRPVAGQIVEVRPERPFRRVVFHGGRLYLVPKRGGRLLVGATVAERGWARRPVAGEVVELLGAAQELVPELARAEWVATWAGLRPGTPDGQPVLGPAPGLQGLYLATGHYRNGILLAPITGLLIAALVRGDPAPVNWRPFAPGAERWPADGVPSTSSYPSRPQPGSQPDPVSRPVPGD